MKVLVSDPISQAGLTILKDSGIEAVYVPTGVSPDDVDILEEIQGWVIRSGTRIDEQMITKTKKLQVIGRAGVGVDNVDIQSATRNGIIVMNTPDVNTISAAELTVALILALSRNIPTAHASLLHGKWIRNDLVGSELSGKSLGVVGLGKIGREVIKRCSAFNMRILGYDPYVNKEIINPDEIELMTLDQLTEEADYITIHVPLNESTKNLFDAKRMRKMKPSSRIINVARGGIINENDLTDVLNLGQIAGAAIDVFTQEPLETTNPLLTAKNIVLTPHLGASPMEAKEGVSVAICEQVRDYLLNGKMSNAINVPFADITKLHELKPYLELAEVIGKMMGQLAEHAIRKIHLECSGTISDTKPVMLALLKGLLTSRLAERVNFVNAESLAREQGIHLEQSYNPDSNPYTNLIKVTVKEELETFMICGSVFEGNQLRLVNIMGFEMDVTPFGNMVFSRNKDVPGVIGKVGTVLGEAAINIGAYLLSRNHSDGDAFAVIRVDCPIPDEIMQVLSNLPEIISLKQIHC